MSYASSTPDSQRAPRYRNQAGYYLPPRTPPVASSARVGSSSALSSSAATQTRKRSRQDGIDHSTRHSLPSAPVSNGKTIYPLPRDRLRNSPERTASPPPFVNTKYQLAGGLDTPTAEREEAFENLHNETEDNFRSRWSTSNARLDYDAQGRQMVTVDGSKTGNNGRKRSRSSMEAGSTPSTESWGQYMYGIVGGIWNFCRKNAFGGFSAGGGTPYDMRSGKPQRMNSEDSWSTINDQVGNGHRDRHRVRRTPVPGEYPKDEDELDSSDYHEAEEPDLRPAKRRHTAPGNEWVMVHHEDNLRDSSSAKSTRSMLPRPSSQARQASFKKSRRSSGRVSAVSHAGSPILAKDRSASTASPRSPSQYNAQLSPQSPPSEEIQRYEARRRRDEKQSDASLKKMNQQLNALISEGKKALATKVEIEDDMSIDRKTSPLSRDSRKSNASRSRW